MTSMLVLFREDGRLVDVIPGGVIKGDAVYVGQHRVADGINCAWAIYPEQPVDHLRDPRTGLFTGTIQDLRPFTAEEWAAYIDRETGKIINDRVHPAAPIEEQIGILRDQIVQILNASGLAPTPEFARLNEIAVEEIERAREKKYA